MATIRHDVKTIEVSSTDVTNGYITLLDSTEIVKINHLFRIGSRQDTGYTMNSPSNGNILITDLSENEKITIDYLF